VVILVNPYDLMHTAKISQVVFAGFSADSLAQRIVDCKPKLVITCNAVKRGVKPILLKDIVDAGLAESESRYAVQSEFCIRTGNSKLLSFLDLHKMTYYLLGE
jgi:acyl-coenzyme A synthetase/AMP-(fatty) acid ligase